MSLIAPAPAPGASRARLLPRVRARGASYSREQIGWAMLFLLPTAAGTLAFVVFPVLFSLYLSFHRWSVASPPVFVGLDQYVRLAADPEFGNSLLNTARFVAGYVPGTLVAALGLALLLNREAPLRSLYRVLLFLPSVTSIIVIAEVWLWIYEPRFGLLNQFLGWLGLPNTIPWLADPGLAMGSIVLMSIWTAAGYYAVIYLAGLSGIDRALYEAASIDGAGAWSRFRHITLPLLAPTTFLIVTMLTIGAFQVFGQVFVMTKGGPLRSTEVVVYTIYTTAFERFNLGYASAQAYVVAVIMLVITLIQWRFWGRDRV